MIEFADILFIVACSLSAMYFIIQLVRSVAKSKYLYRSKKSRNSKILSRIVLGIFISSISLYLVQNQKHKNEYKRIERKLDTINTQIKSDSISVDQLDTLIQNIQQTQLEIRKLEEDQLKLNKRIRTNELNKKLSDSIQIQIDSLVKEFTVWKNFTTESKTVVHNGKVVVYNGKRVVMNVKQHVDLYRIDRFELNPIPKKLNFTSVRPNKTAQYYIDSLELCFRVLRNTGDINRKRNSIDSLLFISLTPIANDYSSYNYIKSDSKDTIYCVDSLAFTANSTYTMTIDFPNSNGSDTTFCIGFHLKRGKIGEYCF